MRFDIYKKINDIRRKEEESTQIPLRLPVPEPREIEEEEVSVISHIIEIDLA